MDEAPDQTQVPAAYQRAPEATSRRRGDLALIVGALIVSALGALGHLAGLEPAALLSAAGGAGSGLAGSRAARSKWISRRESHLLVALAFACFIALMGAVFMRYS